MTTGLTQGLADIINSNSGKVEDFLYPFSFQIAVTQSKRY